MSDLLNNQSKSILSTHSEFFLSPKNTNISWPLLQPIFAPPTQLPESIDATLIPLPYPVENQLQPESEAFLPGLPQPHYDELWPQAHHAIFKNGGVVWVDFLAEEKARLQAKLPLDSPEHVASREITPTEIASVVVWQAVWSVVREIGETIILTAIIFFLIQTVIRNFRVVGTSMVDNLHDGQYLIVDKLSYGPIFTQILGIGGIKRGDVIVFIPPLHPNDDYVKRVIGLSGETVQVIQGRVFINNEPLAEPFQPQPGSYNMDAITVEAGRIFVLGDNRNNSNDSHNWGTLPIENIVGRAWLSYWPPDQWGVIPRDIPTKEATLKYFFQEFVPNVNAEE